MTVWNRDLCITGFTGQTKNGSGFQVTKFCFDEPSWVQNATESLTKQGNTALKCKEKKFKKNASQNNEQYLAQIKFTAGVVSVCSFAWAGTTLQPAFTAIQ